MPRREPRTEKLARPEKPAKPARTAEPIVIEPTVEPIVEPAEPIVEDGEDDAELPDDLGDLAALPPDDDLDDDGDAPVVDVGPAPLVKRSAVAIPEGEWVRDEGPEIVDDDTVPATPRGDDLYAAFVREATRVPRLSEEEERALGLKVRDRGDAAAAKKLVVHNLRLAIKMAHQYRRSWTNLMDLVQEASAGMAIASQRWDPDQGTRFGTYAVFWMRAQLTKFLMTHGRAIHTGNTRAGRKLYFQLPRVRRKLLAEGKEPSVENIAKEVQEDPEEVARIVARLDGREASLDAQVGQEDDGSTLGDLIANEESGPETNAARQEVQEVLSGVMKRFADTLDNERDKAIWTEHLIAHEPKSLVELGARYGVSKQRMGQLATRIKRAFRRHVIDELGPSTQLHWLFGQD
jgi:RNA polymerase sigma-32 factor